MELISTGAVGHATELSEQLRRASGISRLRELLTTQFAARADVLKARTALLALELAFHRSAPPPDLSRRLEELKAGAHELTELRLIDALREDTTLLRPGRGGTPRGACQLAPTGNSSHRTVARRALIIQLDGGISGYGPLAARST